jgi:hypothetical protein
MKGSFLFPLPQGNPPSLYWREGGDLLLQTQVASADVLVLKEGD